MGSANIGTHFRRVLATCALSLAMLAALSGCGARFAYNRLDWIAHHYLANQVELDDTQSQALRTDLDTFLDWHRHSELPRYAGFLDRLATEAARPLDDAQLDAGRREVEGFLHDSVAHAAPDMARWLNGLRPEQIDELFASFAAKEQKARERHCGRSAAERREEAAQRFIDNVEDWTGTLSSAQRALVTTRLATFRDDACEEVSRRERSRRELRALIDRYRLHPEFAERIATFFAQPRAAGEDRARLVKLLVDLNHSLTPDQRRRTVLQLRAHAQELRSLSGGPSV
jgi:Family of unknown function (DUF6279)